jgi:ATP/maltotriose-dependent transcriptional regulator MalT
MKRLLSLWVVGCQLVTLITSLSPSQETNLKIVISTVCSLIGYVVDEVVDVDNEIIRQFMEWDCNVYSETDKAIVYCLTQQSVE